MKTNVLIRSSSGRPKRYGHVHVISYLELPGVQCDVVITASPARAGLPQLLHAVAASAGVRVHGGELEHGPLGPSVRIDLSDQCHQLTQSAVQPVG